MNYTRSPLKEKQNQYKHIKTQNDHIKQKEYTSPYNRQYSYKKNKYLQKSSNDKNNISQFVIGPNHFHTKSQIIYEPENEYEQKYQYQYQYTKTNRNQHKIQKDKGLIQQKKFSAKQSQMQSKINKINNYQNKIQSLLDFVRLTTPNKIVDRSFSYLPSKSVSKLTTPLAPKQPKYQHQRQNTKSMNKPQKNNQLSNYKKDQAPSKNIQIEQNTRKNKYFRNQVKIMEQKRRKSRQFMKNIQGQVKQIKNTVQQLNQKIKKVDYPFKKQIVLDLSSSNPQSLKQQTEGKQNQRTVKQQASQIIKKYDFENQKKDKNLSKYQRYKMNRNKLTQQIEIQSYQNRNQNYKKTGYIYNFKP